MRRGAGQGAAGAAAARREQPWLDTPLRAPCRRLIKELKVNHEAQTSEALARNCLLIRELNTNIAAVRGGSAACTGVLPGGRACMLRLFPVPCQSAAAVLRQPHFSSMPASSWLTLLSQQLPADCPHCRPPCPQVMRAYNSIGDSFEAYMDTQQQLQQQQQQQDGVGGQDLTPQQQQQQHAVAAAAQPPTHEPQAEAQQQQVQALGNSGSGQDEQQEQELASSQQGAVEMMDDDDGQEETAEDAAVPEAHAA